MSQDLILFESDAQLPAVYQGMDVNDDLSDGVGGSYAVMSLKGSRFRIKWQGSETVVTDLNSGDPVTSFEAVIVKANKAITKQYYVNGYTDGSTDTPDCFSLDGVSPAAAVENPQNSKCATCKMNAFGSRINEQTGVKSKACADNRKLAILPLGDLKNELFGGPMLLRISATALKDLATFSDTLKARGYPYNAVAVRIGFDLTVSYPKPVFKAIRLLTEEEAQAVLEWYSSEHVEKVLSLEMGTPAQDVPAQTAIDEVFEQPPPAQAKPAPQQAPKPTGQVNPPVVQKTAPKPSPAPTQQAKPPAPPAAKKAPAPAPKPTAAKPPAAPAPAPKEPEPTVEDPTTETVPGNLEDDIAGILSDLNSLASE